MTVYLATAGYCVLSALVPVVNAETYLVAVAALTDPPDIWLLAGCAAGGQMVGKCIYYLAGRGALRLPGLLRRKTRPGRWARRLEDWREKAEQRPVYAAGLVLVSAFVGLPPFAAIAVLSGVVRLSPWLFVPLGFAGRYGRFAALLAAPGVWRFIVHST